MNRAASIALLPLSALYGAAVQTRNALYRRGSFKSHDIGVPVISIGNITVGGTGKTPLVEWIAKQLAQRGLRVCVLTRGYGRQTTGRLIVSDAEAIRADVTQAGDEAFLLAEKLKGQAAIICDANRVGAARWAIENLRSEVFLLDDGFQHQRIARNLNIVTIDATNPWGNGELLPSGILREPRESLKRADCVVIARANQSQLVADLDSQITEICGDVPTFLSRINLADLHHLNSANQANPDSPVAAFCGIANPESFFAMLREAGYNLVHTQICRDHKRYTQADIERIIAHAKAHGAEALITTAKDAVKVRSMSFALPCYVAELSIEIDREEEFQRLILNAAQR